MEPKVKCSCCTLVLDYGNYSTCINFFPSLKAVYCLIAVSQEWLILEIGSYVLLDNKHMSEINELIEHRVLSLIANVYEFHIIAITSSLLLMQTMLDFNAHPYIVFI